jgi:acyl dehydratase
LHVWNDRIDRGGGEGFLQTPGTVFPDGSKEVMMNSSGFGVPVENRYFEDYVLNSVHEFGAIPVETEEIVSFGQQFDPQVFHTDPDAAKATMYGGLIASGWHTASLMMREFVGHYLSKVASLGSPGVDELRWNMPVRPGDRLTVRVTITQADRSRSKPDRGIVHSFIEVLNQDRNVVMSMKAVNFLLCRLPNQLPH